MEAETPAPPRPDAAPAGGPADEPGTAPQPPVTAGAPPPSGPALTLDRDMTLREAFRQIRRSAETTAAKLAATATDISRSHAARSAVEARTALETARKEATQAAAIGAALAGRAAELVRSVARDPAKRSKAADMAQLVAVQGAYIAFGPIVGNVAERAAKIIHKPADDANNPPPAAAAVPTIDTQQNSAAQRQPAMPRRTRAPAAKPAPELPAPALNDLPRPPRRSPRSGGTGR